MRPETAQLLQEWRSTPERADERAAVLAVLSELSRAAPGHSVELRVPPHGAVQVVAGPRHRRGTPKATVEMPPITLLELATGTVDWEAAIRSGAVLASGERADLAALFPL